MEYVNYISMKLAKISVAISGKKPSADLKMEKPDMSFSHK